MVGFNVGRRAGKHQAVKLLQQVSLIKLLTQCRDDDWHTTCHLNNCLQVFITGSVVDVVPDLLGAGTNADYRLARHETPVLLLLWV